MTNYDVDVSKIEKEVKNIIDICDDLIQQENFSELKKYYAEDAVLVVKPDMFVQGRENIAVAFKKIASYFKNSLKPVEGEMRFLIAGDTVLVLAQTFIQASTEALETSEYSSERRATYVFKKIDDSWVCAIDNSYGTSLLD